jgi:MscS family membrane protein
MTLIRTSGVLLAAFVLLVGGTVHAQEEPTLKDVLGDEEVPEEAPEATQPAPQAPPTPAAAAPPAGPVDDFDRGVPRTSLRGFFEAGDAGDWERAAEYLDLRNLPKQMRPPDGPTLARHFKVALDRTLWVAMATVSMDPGGHKDDGLPAYRDRVGVIDTPEGKIEILMQRVPREDGVSIWKISNHTVKDIPLLWKAYGYSPLVEKLRRILPEGHFLGFEYWQWVGIIVILLAAYLLAWVSTMVPAQLLQRRAVAREGVVRFLTGPVRLLVFVLVARFGVELLAPSLVVRAVLRAEPLLIIVTAWLVIRASDLLFARLLVRLQRDRSAGAVFVRPLRTMTQILVVLVAGLVWLANIGFNVGAVLAGLGIGGIAVALAAQRSLEDVFGAITLYSGRPVRVGDFCRFGGKLGTVEEIGLRWTRVRTLDDTVVNLSNADFAKEKLENFTVRKKIWYHPRLRLRYQTTPDQLRYILVEVRRLLYAHPRVLPDPARVRFVGFGDYSLDLDVFAYLETTDYGEFLEIAEDLNLRIMDVLKKAGSDFALPSRTAYVESGTSPDGELARAAEASVGQWREEGQLYLPRFPQEKVSELRRSLPYPPEGSPDATRAA